MEKTVAKTTKKSDKKSRVDLRLESMNKALLENAAQLTGQSLSSFILEASLREARKTIQEHEVIELTRRDWEIFQNLILNPPPPNEKLKSEMKKYLALLEDSDD